jgi:hypothetical protein
VESSLFGYRYRSYFLPDHSTRSQFSVYRSLSDDDRGASLPHEEKSMILFDESAAAGSSNHALVPRMNETTGEECINHDEIEERHQESNTISQSHSAESDLGSMHMLLSLAAP